MAQNLVQIMNPSYFGDPLTANEKSQQLSDLVYAYVHALLTISCNNKITNKDSEDEQQMAASSLL